MQGTQSPETKPEIRDAEPPEEPSHRTARRLSYFTSLWSVSGGGWMTPPESFQGLLEQNIDRGRSVWTVWARWLALGGAIFWAGVAVMPVGSAPFPLALLAVGVLLTGVIAWYRDRIGGWLFVGEAVAMAAYLLVAATDRSGIVVFSLPALVTGLLFLTGRRPSAALPGAR